MAASLRFSGVTVDHPGARERDAGAESQVKLQLFTEQGQLREAPLDEADLIKLIADASKVLQIITRKRVEG